MEEVLKICDNHIGYLENRKQKLIAKEKSEYDKEQIERDYRMMVTTILYLKSQFKKLEVETNV